MIDQARELRERARNQRTEANLDEAGGLYTRAAHEYVGGCELSFPEPTSTHLAVGSLLDAATCYRVVGDEFRTQNRCELGTVLVEDYEDFVNRHDIAANSFEDLRRGAWPEFLGDLRTIADTEGADDAYDRAIAMYEGAGDFELTYAEQEHTRLAAFFRSVRRGAGERIAEDDPEQLDPGTTFSEWVDYKREHLPRLLDQLASQGTWPEKVE